MGTDNLIKNIDININKWDRRKEVGLFKYTDKNEDYLWSVFVRPSDCVTY
jgi:hypothetical protein